LVKPLAWCVVRIGRSVRDLYFDTQVHNAAIFEHGEPITLEPVGGGGISFCPCFEYIEEAIDPAAGARGIHRP